MLTLPFIKNEKNKETHAKNDYPIISLRGVDKLYKTAVGDFPALKEVDLDIHAGEFVSVIGKSGSGKTTLLNMITGIDRPSTGEVWVNGTPVHGLSQHKMARWRGINLGIVFQFFQLLPMLSVIENIMLPMDFCKTFPKNERKARALDLLDQMELADHAYKLPSGLSGGQQQRVAIARALANDPPIIIADEPTGNLDSKTAERVFELFNKLVSQGKTIIIVTHDSGLAKRAKRTALIADGEIVNGGLRLMKMGSGDHFYVVSKGSVEVIMQRENTSDVIVAQLGPGKYFGEMEFFQEREHRASVRASESGPVEVLALDYKSLNTLLENSEGAREALKNAAEEHAQENVQHRGAQQ